MQRKMSRYVIQVPTTLIKPQYATIRDDRVHGRNVKPSEMRNKATYVPPHTNVCGRTRPNSAKLIHYNTQYFMPSNKPPLMRYLIKDPIAIVDYSTVSYFHK